MNNTPKICPLCNAVNDADAAFCRCCGKPIPEQTQPEPQTAQPTYQSGAYQYQQTPPPPPPYYTYASEPGMNYEAYQGDIFGVPAKEVAAYVGKNNTQKYMRDFYNRAATGKKAGFNVPVFLLGLLLGPFFMSFWFFYRKCNKIGAILAAVGAVLMIGTAAAAAPMVDMIANVSANSVQYAQDNYNYGGYSYNFDENGFEFNFDTDDFEDNFGQSGNSLTPSQLGIKAGPMLLFLAVAAITNIISLVLTIVCAIFANAWYLRGILAKITAMKQTNPQTTLADIERAGGVAYAAWVTLMCVYIVLSIVAAVGIAMYILSFIMPAALY